MNVRGDRLRRIVRRFHLWLGLSFGGLLVLLGLTGSVLAFYPELDAVLHPVIGVANLHQPGAPDFDRALATLRADFPDKPGPWRLEVTGEPGAIPARYYKPPEREGYAFRPLMVWLTPDGGAVLRRDYWGEYAMTFIYDIHNTLLLGSFGGALVGWLGFGMLALLLSGLWAWWPRGSWGKALRLKRRAHRQRVLRDWHKLSGLSGLVFLLILTVTGIMLALPEESDTVLNASELRVNAPPLVRDAEAEGLRLTPSGAIAAARQALPGARLAWIETPPATGGMYRIRMQVPGDPSYRFPHSYVWVDGASGKVAAVQDTRTEAAGSTVNAWLHPLHDGSAGGLWGRVLAAIAGLVPLALFVTGWMRWRGRSSGARTA